MLLPEECCLPEIETIHQQMCELMDSDELILDATDVTRLDDSFIQLLVAANMEVDSLLIRNATDIVKDTLVIYGLDDLLEEDSA